MVVVVVWAGLNLNTHPLTAEGAAPKCQSHTGWWRGDAALGGNFWRGMESEELEGSIRLKRGIIRELRLASTNSDGVETEGNSVARLGFVPITFAVAGVVVCLVAMSGSLTEGQQVNGQASGTSNGTSNGTPNEKTVLRGTVVNAVTHEPIGRAVVKSQDGRYATMTNERGRFEMVFKEKKSVAPAGAAVSTANAQQFSAGSYSFSSRSGEGQAQQTTVDRPDFVTATRQGFLDDNPGGVAVARDQDEVTISLMPEARVVGHVLLADGEGALGMQVLLYQRMVQGGGHGGFKKTTRKRDRTGNSGSRVCRPELTNCFRQN